MNSQRAAIVQAAAVALAAASGQSEFGGTTFNVVRQYTPGHALEDLNALTVTLPPLGPEDRELIQRDMVEKRFSFDIGIQQRLPGNINPEAPAGNDWLDSLMGFSEAVAAFFEPNAAAGKTGQIGSSSAAFWMTSRIDPAYDPNHLREYRVFTSRVILTVRYY